MISRIIKVEAWVISPSLITKTELNKKKNGDDNLLVKIYKSASNTAGELGIVTLRNHALRSYMT